MKVVRLALSYCFLSVCPLLLLFLLPAASLTAQNAIRRYPGRGSVSAQDMGKILHPASLGTTAADQVCARFTQGSVVTDPPVLQSQNGVLEVTMNYNTVTDSQGLVRYCYVTNGGLESPTLVVNPGDQLIVHFTNNLPVASSPMTAMNPCNGMMGDNMTNMHFHGTDVAPVCGQDEVVHTLVAPGQSFDYKLQIPTQEAPGLYWYHPHPHGISETQVQGGATGALIVQGIQNVYPALARMPERTLVIRDQLLPSAEANDANIPAWDLSLNYVPVTYPGYAPATIQTLPGEKELWRVANTGADSILNLQYVVNGTAQAMQVYAIDGYPLSSNGSITQTSIQLGPGARAEFVVTTPNVGDTAQLVTAYQNTGPDGDFDPSRPIANVVSQTNAAAAPTLPAQTGTANSTLFKSLAGLTPTAHRNLYFSEVLQNPADPDSPTNFYITQVGQTPALFTMDQPVNITVHAGTVEDWTVENRAQEDHVFHIHQLHFQVIAVNGVAVNDPTLRDTYDIPYWSGTGAYPSITVRMDFSDPNIIGTFVYHCHILEHEDGGMMGLVQVLPAGTAASATVTASASSIVPNQNVTLLANVVDASTRQTTPTGLVQFQMNGVNIGNPTAISNGQVSITTAVNGNVGSNNLVAFYEGDNTYAGSTSAPVPITVSPFAMTSSGTSAAVGSAAIATVNVNVANNYANTINLTCTLPSALTEAACFVDPGSITGTGTVQLTVNSTPAHPLNSGLTRRVTWAGGGSASLACILLFFCPRRRWRNTAIGLLIMASLGCTILGCSSPQRTDAGTPKGTYQVVVTGTAGSGSSQYQTTTNVPITIQ